VRKPRAASSLGGAHRNREALDQDKREVALKMAEVVRNVPLDEGERAVKARERVVGVDVRPRVVDHNRNSAHEVTRNPGLGLLLHEEADQVGEHVSAFN